MRLSIPATICSAVMGLAACATYEARPLGGDDIAAVLEAPDRAVLARQGSALSHPRIAPLTLDFSRPLTDDAIAVIAVLANPDLRAARAQQGVVDAQAFAAGLLPDPQLSIGIDRVLSPADQGLSTAYAGGLTLDLLGALATRGVQRQAAGAAVLQVRLDLAWQEWTVAGQARLLAVRLPRQREMANLARIAADVAEAALRRTLSAAARGDLKGDEVEARRLAAADATARALTAAREADVTRLELNRLLGLKPGEALDVAAPFPLGTWSPPDADALFDVARGARLDLQALAAGYDSREAALHRAVLGQYPRLAITVNRARDTGRVQTFGPAVTLDLPLWNRNRGAIATAGADREKLRAEYAARLVQTRAEIAALVTTLERDERARAGLAAQVAQIEHIADRFEAAARRGDLTVPAAESARASAVDKQFAYLALDQACAEQRIALMIAVGRTLSEPTMDPRP